MNGLTIESINLTGFSKKAYKDKNNTYWSNSLFKLSGFYLISVGNILIGDSSSYIYLCSGDGDINYTNIESWYHVLDSRNISYVAWNLSNSKGTSSILKQFTTSLTDFSDNALKEWGIYYKNHVRERFNFPDLYDKNNQ